MRPTMLSDELLQYDAGEGDRLLLSGPQVRLQPKAGQVLALALHELAVNAVEHGALGVDGGQIEVSWIVADTKPSKLLALTWTERGRPPNIDPARSGFGTEMLTRMLAYNLKAETDIIFGRDGLRCTIHLPLPPQVGLVVPR